MIMSVQRWLNEILGYLADNQSQAFDSGALATRVRGRKTDGLAGMNDSDFHKALQSLESSGSVISRTFNGKKHYFHRSLSNR